MNMMLTAGFLLTLFIKLRKVPSIGSSLLSVFIMEMCYILTNAFCIDWNDHVRSSFPIYVVYYID